jgi:hypothetical protein
MPGRQNTITKEIRREMLAKASIASSRDEVMRAIFDAIVEAGVDWRTVPVDEVKSVLVAVLRASKGRTVRCGEPIAA